MVVAIILVVVALLVAGIAVIAFVAKRNALQPVAAGPRPRLDGPSRVAGPSRTGSLERSYDDSGSTGPVEVLIPAASVPAPTTAAPAAAVAAPALFDLEREPEVAVPAPEIRWSKQFDPRSGSLDDVARLRLIGDLGVVAKEWCVPLLRQAYEEERRPAHRQAALIALSSCRSRAAISTYRLALASGDDSERAIATDALADLELPAQIKPRTVVERR